MFWSRITSLILESVAIRSWSWSKSKFTWKFEVLHWFWLKRENYNVKRPVQRSHQPEAGLQFPEKSKFIHFKILKSKTEKNSFQSFSILKQLLLLEKPSFNLSTDVNLWKRDPLWILANCFSFKCSWWSDNVSRWSVHVNLWSGKLELAV